MKILKKYTAGKTYMFPDGTIATPEIIAARYPAVQVFTHIVETDEGGEVFFAILNLSAMRTLHGISSSLSEAEVIAALQIAINTVPVQEASAEERIAAAMEFQNLISL